MAQNVKLLKAWFCEQHGIPEPTDGKEMPNPAIEDPKKRGENDIEVSEKAVAAKDDRLMVLWAQRILKLADSLLKKGLEKRAKTLQNRVSIEIGVKEIPAAFNPYKKRTPAGSLNGGRWEKEGGSNLADKDHEKEK